MDKREQERVIRWKDILIPLNCEALFPIPSSIFLIKYVSIYIDSVLTDIQNVEYDIHTNDTDSEIIIYVNSHQNIQKLEKLFNILNSKYLNMLKTLHHIQKVSQQNIQKIPKIFKKCPNRIFKTPSNN